MNFKLSIPILVERCRGIFIVAGLLSVFQHLPGRWGRLSLCLGSKGDSWNTSMAHWVVFVLFWLPMATLFYTLNHVTSSWVLKLVCCQHGMNGSLPRPWSFPNILGLAAFLSDLKLKPLENFLLIFCFWQTAKETAFIWERVEVFVSTSHVTLISSDCLMKNGWVSFGGEKGRDQSNKKPLVGEGMVGREWGMVRQEGSQIRGYQRGI